MLSITYINVYIQLVLFVADASQDFIKMPVWPVRNITLSNQSRSLDPWMQPNWTPLAGFDAWAYLRQSPPQLSLTLLQLQGFAAVGVLQAQHGLLALPQLCVELLQLTPEGQHLAGSLRHFGLTLPQLLLEQRDFSCFLTHLPNKEDQDQTAVNTLSSLRKCGLPARTYSPK